MKRFCGLALACCFMMLCSMPASAQIAFPGQPIGAPKAAQNDAAVSWATSNPDDLELRRRPAPAGQRTDASAGAPTKGRKPFRMPATAAVSSMAQQAGRPPRCRAWAAKAHPARGARKAAARAGPNGPIRTRPAGSRPPGGPARHLTAPECDLAQATDGASRERTRLDTAGGRPPVRPGAARRAAKTRVRPARGPPSGHAVPPFAPRPAWRRRADPHGPTLRPPHGDRCRPRGPASPRVPLLH